MFSENEVFFIIMAVLAIYIGMSVIWRRALHAMNNDPYTAFTRKFEIKYGDRIFSVSEDYINDGIWCQIVVTLWRDRRNKSFYLSKTYEYNKDKPLQEFVYLETWKAKETILKYAPKDESNRLVAEWIERNGRAL